MKTLLDSLEDLRRAWREFIAACQDSRTFAAGMFAMAIVGILVVILSLVCGK